MCTGILLSFLGNEFFCSVGNQKGRGWEKEVEAGVFQIFSMKNMSKLFSMIDSFTTKMASVFEVILNLKQQ